MFFLGKVKGLRVDLNGHGRYIKASTNFIDIERDNKQEGMR